MKHSKFLLILTLLSIAGCMPPASVVKGDVEANAKKTRDDVVDLQSKDQVDDTDITRTKEITLDETNTLRNFVEFRGKQEGVKFKDPRWKDFPISAEFNVVPLRNYFELLNRLTNINFILGDEVKGDITLNIKDVSWIESLDIVLRSKSLISEVNAEGNVVTVHAQDFSTTQSESMLKAISAKKNLVKAYNNLDTKTTAIVRLYYTKPDILAAQLKDVVASLDAGGAQGGQPNAQRASFVIDARTNSIIIQANNNDMEWIKTAIANLDRPTKQVLVDVFIVEATDDFQAQLGSRVGVFNTGKTGILGTRTITGTLDGAATSSNVLSGTVGNVSSNPIGGTPLGGLAVTLAGASTALRVELQAMQQDQMIKIVSNPKLFIIDNELATITDGQEVPYTTTSAVGSPPSVSFKSAALQLQVKPSIIGDGNVYLDINVNKDSVLNFKAGENPAISTKQLKTKLLIRDGGVAMIGGINKSDSSVTENGVPILSKLPGIGNLFKSKSDQKNKNQLYIFLAPRVL
jgi:type IV pilus assembly protein PilQ